MVQSRPQPSSDPSLSGSKADAADGPAKSTAELMPTPQRQFADPILVGNLIEDQRNLSRMLTQPPAIILGSLSAMTNRVREFFDGITLLLSMTAANMYAAAC